MSPIRAADPPTYSDSYQASAYQQLAAIHKSEGHDRDASRILMAQQDHRRASVLQYNKATARHGRWTKRRLWLHRRGLGVLKLTTGYGYRPGRAVWWLAGLLLVSFFLVFGAARTHVGVTTTYLAARPPASSLSVGPNGAFNVVTNPPAACSAGERVGLTLRIAVPIISNLSQGNCTISTSSKSGVYLFYSLGASILQAIAWILGILYAAAAANLIRKA